MKGQGKLYLFVALCVALMLSGAFYFGFFRHIQELLTDFLYTPRLPSTDILIVEIDESSIVAAGQWPWPRQKFADLIKNLQSASVIAIDINFKEQSNLGQADDTALQEAILNSKPKIVLTAELQPDGSVSRPGGTLRGITAEGFPNIFISSDSVVRFSRLQKDNFPSLSFKVAGLHNKDLVEQLALSPEAPLRIAYAGPDKTQSSVTAIDVLNNKIPKEFFQDKIILIGATARDLQDYHKTPFGLISGVEIQASIIQTILGKTFYASSSYLTYALITVFAFLAVLFALLLARPIFFVGALVGTMLLYTLAVFLAFDSNYVLNLFYPNVALFLSGAFVLTTQYSVTAREKKFIQDTFGRYLSPDVIKELIADPSALKLGGKREHLTILFSDIRNFTDLSEHMTPERLTNFLNNYLNRMTQIILRHNGVVDKYIGDAVMAFWGAPLPNTDHARAGVRSAIEMVEELKKFNAINKKRGVAEIEIGIGINTGEVTVGNMGSEHRFDYTVIGDNVNLASRLEGLTKLYGVNIIISEGTLKHIDKNVTLVRELDTVRVKGKQQSVKIYEVIPKSQEQTIVRVKSIFDEARTNYYQGHWPLAIEQFEEILKNLPDDGPIKLLLERSREFLNHPPENWDGVYTLLRK